MKELEFRLADRRNSGFSLSPETPLFQRKDGRPDNLWKCGHAVEHPQGHLAKFRGILLADAYAAINRLYEGGAIQEAPCLAHIRRKFFELMVARQSPIATGAVGTNRRARSDREGDTRPTSGTTPIHTQLARSSLARVDAIMDASFVKASCTQVRHRIGDPLCPCPLGRSVALGR